MTQEEKEKVYIELINRLEDVKEAIKKQNYGIAMDVLCKPYPEFQVTTHSELKDSENENIRKLLIEAVIQVLQDQYCSNRGVSKEKVVAWLEKQGNLMKALQISNAKIGELIEKNYYLKEQFEKQSEHTNFLNKIQIGDKVTRNEDGVLVNLSQLNRVAKKDEKQGENNMGISEATKQKLEDNLNKALEKETPESWNKFLDRQGEQKPVIKMKTPEESLSVDSDTYSKIVDECVYGEQKPAWSEEDERIYKSIAYSFAHNYPLTVQQQEFVKSLKDRYTWKPSDEQMDALRYVTNFDYGGYKATLVSLYEQLKKLRGGVSYESKQNTTIPL